MLEIAFLLKGSLPAAWSMRVSFDRHLKDLHNAETRFDCPQTFLYLDFRDGVSELK